MEPRDRLILALDFTDADLALELADRTREWVGLYKVGLPLVLGSGLGVVDRLRREGHQVFLDLKFHDIPTAVGLAVREASRRCVRMVTTHASGGPAMLQHAVTALSDVTLIPGEPPPLVLAVTILTHMDGPQLEAVGLGDNPHDAVLRLATLARDAGADGVVASPQEAAAIREACGDSFLIVCPGVRPAGTRAEDQARIATPTEAIRRGADYLVVGRPVRSAVDPAAAARMLVDEIAAAQA